MTEAQWDFIFFRSVPENLEVRAALTSSIQSIDTVLLLIGLRRYPHALSTCATIIESVIKSSRVGSKLERSKGLGNLLKLARRESVELAGFPAEMIDEFKEARNRITHEGFSPKDDSESVRLLIEVGFPFLALCLQHLHSFNLWDAILQEYVRQFRICTTVLHRAKGIPDLDYTYCLMALSYLIQWNLKENFSADWEVEALGKSAADWVKFEFNTKRREYLERVYDAFWSFDCPICDEPDSAVCELDSNQLQSRNVIPLSMACINCGFKVSKKRLFLVEALLGEHIAQAKEQVLQEYGFGNRVAYEDDRSP